MDPFGDGSENTGDLGDFQAPTDASYGNDFYEVDASMGSAPAAFDPNFDPMADPLAEPTQQEQAPESSQSFSYEPEPVSYEQPAAVSYSAPEPVSAGIPVVEEENELTKFLRDLQEKTAQKAIEQEKVAVESKAKAESDMQQFLAERARKKETKHTANRTQEQATMEKLAADLEGENPWERVVSLVDLDTNSRKKRLEALKEKSKGKAQEEPSKNAKKEEEEDVSRMRQLFVQLKGEPLEKTRAASIASH
ncbi:TPA: hypothetical protein N0F65_003965 [Lagenidium giganteum]|uniref:Clathrin light chain n=1 Tax=Lagenidium giganteum TaxID=4803 RepID=A0AAV2YWS7_9STRA|nr:TPA: hypothetical protein N0F65_003965 [Lagenidium giganteum]